jgi:hypothetical protein
MAVLPSRHDPSPLTLDALATRADALAEAWRPAPRPQPQDARRTIPPPRRLPPQTGLAPAAATPSSRQLALDPPSPIALILPVVIAHCDTCGCTHRTAAHYALAQYAVNAHSYRYSRAALSDCAGLPRSLRETETRVPFCASCFLDGEETL